ncbi:MAG: tetratricopeptide repeat protein, partial [Thermoplasmata archaeon]
MMEGEEKKGKCPSCEGKIRPLVTCDICGFSTVREELEPVREEETCPVCEVPAKVVFECEECGDTYPFSKIVPEEERKLVCPMCGAFVDPDAKNCSSCGSSFAVEETEKIAVEKDRLRKKRRVVGEFEEEDIQEIMRIPGVGRLRAEILCKAGYTSLAKLNRASVEDLARVRQIGQRTAKSIKEALQLMYVEPIESQRLLEELIEEEFECPVCKTIVSAYDGECYECGSIFEREVFDEGFVKEIEKVGEEKSSLSLFDMKLLDNPEDAELWVARGALLKKMGNYKEALKSYDRAIEVRPGLKSAWIAKAEILTNLGKFEEAASCYRGIVDESATAAGIEFGEREEAVVALEELAMEDCPSCGSPIPLGSRKCPSCGLKLIPEEEAIIPPEEAFEEEIVPEKVPKRKRAKRRPVKVKRKVTKAPGLTNGRGMVNGKGKINGTGLVNGKGLVNGRGLVNGKGVVNGRGRVNGLINGNGFINGMSLTEMRRVTRRRMWPRYVVLAMAFFILAMGLYGIVPPAEKPTTPISIDGDFTDWQGVSLYSDQNQGANPNTTIATYGIRSDDGYLSFLVGVQGTALGDATGYDSFYVFM